MVSADARYIFVKQTCSSGGATASNDLLWKSEERHESSTLDRAKKECSGLAFYTGKLRYTIAAISPSRWPNTLVGADMTYEIFCKTFDADAKSILEDGNF